MKRRLEGMKCNQNGFGSRNNENHDLMKAFVCQWMATLTYEVVSGAGLDGQVDLSQSPEIVGTQEGADSYAEEQERMPLNCIKPRRGPRTASRGCTVTTNTNHFVCNATAWKVIVRRARRVSVRRTLWTATVKCQGGVKRVEFGTTPPVAAAD